MQGGQERSNLLRADFVPFRVCSSGIYDWKLSRTFRCAFLSDLKLFAQTTNRYISVKNLSFLSAF